MAHRSTMTAVAPLCAGSDALRNPAGTPARLCEVLDCCDIQERFVRRVTVLSVAVTVQGLHLFLKIPVKAARHIPVIQVGYSFREIP